MSKFVNTLHHVVAVTVDGVEYTHAAGEVWEADGAEAEAWEANPGVASAKAADERRADNLAAVRAAGGDPNDSGMPSGTITTVGIPTLQDIVRGLVRDNVAVAMQPTLPVTGGGELRAVPDEKAAMDRIGDGGVSHEDFRALQGAEAEDGFDDFTDEELRGYADEHDIDLGQSRARSGLLSKIRAAELARAEEAEANADGSGSVPGV